MIDQSALDEAVRLHWPRWFLPEWLNLVPDRVALIRVAYRRIVKEKANAEEENDAPRSRGREEDRRELTPEAPAIRL